MTRRSTVRLAVLAVVTYTSSLFAQMNLNSFYSRDVKQAISVATQVDSVQTSTTVGNGTATTIVTMVLTPVPYDPSYYGGRVPSATASLDSIEITLGFWLPSDFVAKNMWLWVKGEPQTAYIQDRALASGQYNEIVGKRKDPALLEFWGNGSYNFRMFPARLNASRKVAIEFEHTFDDDSAGLITAHVPLTFDSTFFRYWNYSGAQCVRTLSAAFAANDGRSYQAVVPGVGTGSFSLTAPLVLNATKVRTLETATISTADPSGAQTYFWTGRDTSDRIVTGCAAVIADSTVTMEPEPDTRIIVVDVRERTWDWDDYQKKQYAANNWGAYPYTIRNPIIDLWLKAQKYAVLCLQNYVRPGHTFNVVFAGRQARSVFPSPVSYSAENLQKAFLAIAAASPDPAASTEGALAVATEMAAKGVVILVSDLYQPYDYWVNRYDAVTKTYLYTSPGKPAFDSLVARIGRQVISSGCVLFTICDAWEISNIANQTGGYNLASLRYTYYYALTEFDDYTGRHIPRLPKLFGSDNYSRGLQNLAVSGNLDSLSFASDGYYGYYGRGIMVDDARFMAAKRADVWWGYYQPNQTTLRIAGFIPPTRSSTQVELKVTGRLGGLGFTKTLKGSWTPDALARPMADNVGWAFLRSEQLAGQDWSANNLAIKKIGIDYHIVTRQTALLALEPGMELWPDTNSQSQGNQGGTAEKGVALLDASSTRAPSVNGAAASGSDLDKASLDDLIAMNMGVHNRPLANGTSLAAHVSGSLVRISLPLESKAGALQITLHDLAGRLLVAKKIGQHMIKGGVFVTDLSPVIRNSPAGYYILKVRFAGQELKLRIMPR